jgi:glycosyltransferase involved in cell wall biosynthesis
MAFLDSTLDINLVTPLNQLGYGIAGLNIMDSLTKAGHTVSLSLLGQSQVPHRYADSFKTSADNGKSPNFDAPCIRIWHQHDMTMFVGNGTKIGFPIFELDRFTDLEIHHLAHPDKLFVCSQWAKDVVVRELETKTGKENVSKDVHIIPLGVDRDIFKENISPKKETVFFNCGKWEKRKGHDLIHEAFSRAFTEDDDVELWMMCENPFLSQDDNFSWERTYRGSKLGDKVRIVPRQPTQEEVYQVMTQVDCGVFPARAEGWNLELLEMMSCGKHVIATDYSAHTEFCNSKNSRLIKVEENELAEDGVWFFGQGEWAKLEDKHIDEIAKHMKEIHELKQKDNLRINQEGIETAKKFSWSNSATKIVEALQDDTHT